MPEEEGIGGRRGRPVKVNLHIPKEPLREAHPELAKARIVEAVAQYMKDIGADSPRSAFGLDFDLDIDKDITAQPPTGPN